MKINGQSSKVPRIIPGFLFIITLFLFLSSVSAQTHKIPLTWEGYSLSDCNFYIESVIDKRLNKDDIGFIKEGGFSKKLPIVLENGFVTTLEDYFTKLLPARQDFIPVTIIVYEFRVSRILNNEGEFSRVDITFEYFFGTRFYSDSRHKELKGTNVKKLHESNIKTVLLISLMEFKHVISKEEIVQTNAFESEPVCSINEFIKVDEEKPYQVLPASEFPENRNVTAIGYQIGGYALIGIDYEARIHDYVGIHMGGGYLGYTIGLKIHTNASKNSNFFNLSYKDGGFGQISVIGIEFGGRWLFSNTSQFGLHYQLGLAKITYISGALTRELFRGNRPDAIFSFGIGFSW